MFAHAPIRRVGYCGRPGCTLSCARMKPLIAICSQDADFYLLLSYILEVEGFSSALVSSIDDMRAIEPGPRFDAFVLDCRPDNQLALESARLKRDPRTCALPCVGLVYAGAEEQHLQLLRSGVDRCFVRPFAPAMLLDFLHSHVMPQRRGMNTASSERVLSLLLTLEALRADLASKGVQIIDPDKKAFKDALAKTSFYKDLRAKFGDEAWKLMNDSVGALG